MKATNFTEGEIGSQIMRFALPIIMGNLFMQLYQVIDSVIVGRFLGTEALGAVGASTPVVFATIAIVIGIGSGASVVISQYFGAKQYDKVRITSDTLHIVLLASGVIIAAFGIFFSRDIFHILGLPEELMDHAVSYLSIYLGGIFLLFGFNTISSMLRGVGDSKTPLYFLLFSAVLNVLLDLLFIVVFGWGIASVAWATVISEGVAYMIAIGYINKTSKIFHINLLRLRFDRHIFNQCIKYGLPTGIQQSFVAFGAVAISFLVNRYGADVVAGYSIAMRIDHLAVIPAMNFGMAMVSFSGQNVGAGRYDRVRRGLKITLLYSTAISIVISLVLILFSEPILSIFTTDSAVIGVAHEYLIVVSCFFPFFTIMSVLNGMFRGAGDVIAPMVITSVALWGIRIPSASVLSDSIGSTGIWWSIPFGWCCGMVIALIYYKRGNWHTKSIIKH
ncbi:MAG: MATE family efflux transporter [Rikenellaceae bacterium]